jgi:hypothetical protein
MGLNFSTTSAASVDTGVKFLVHAPPGYGKTMLCATMPNPCIISAEAGLLSLRPDNQKRVYGAALDIPVIEIATAKDLQEALTFFQSSAHAKDLNPCLDSLSEMAEVILASFKRSCKDPRQAYGLMNECMTACIRDFRDLRGKHVYFAAKQDADKDADGVVRRGPAMPGKQLTQNVGHFFDEVFALDIGDMGDANHTKYRFLRTQPNIQFQAKDRSGALLEIEEPNLTKIISKIRSSQS